jgi:hypothetical protein
MLGAILSQRFFLFARPLSPPSQGQPGRKQAALGDFFNTELIEQIRVGSN